jgi:L-ribulose-5-phosphate 4-epimerase
MSRRLEEIINQTHPLRVLCCDLNKELPKNNLVKLTWGNVSLLSEDRKLMIIKPSGVPFDKLNYSAMSVVDVETGELIFGMKPSVDTQIHLEIYKGFPTVNSIVHTHSTHATSWAQALRPIPCLGTTHADYFVGAVPVVRYLTDEELNEYETNLGKIVVEHFTITNLRPETMPAVLLPLHGCLTFGTTGQKALEAAIALEEVALMAYKTSAIRINFDITLEEENLFRKHYERKHGPKKYYGQ